MYPFNFHCVDVSFPVNGEKYMNPWAAMCSQNMDKILKDLGGELKTFTKGTTTPSIYHDYMIN